jgi:hypothetical protein
MATTMSLLELRNAVRQRADIVNSTQFYTDEELNSYINQSAFELYDLLIQKYGDNYYVKTPPYDFFTDGTSEIYPLPSDFYKLLGVDLFLSNSADSRVTVPEFNFSDRNKYSVPNFQTFYGVTNLRYRLNGDNVWFTPIPAGNQKIRLWYVPTMTTLSADSDLLKGISGWTEYVIVDACIKVRQKEESDATIFINQKIGLKERIENAAENRNASSPPTVSDTLFKNLNWQNGNGNGSPI